MEKITLKSPVKQDEYTQYICQHFDYPQKEFVEVDIIDNIKLPESWNIGIIYGPSGSGKSTLLKKFGAIPEISWDSNKAVISQFNLSKEEVISLFAAVGLNNVHTWLKPYHVLSVGEKSRVDLARCLSSKSPIIVIDEFTSTVNRECARSIAIALHKYIKTHNLKIVLASCHNDILADLKPDWIYNTFTAQTESCPVLLRQDTITIQRCDSKIWKYFSYYHYLTDEHSNASRCYLLKLNGEVVGFCSFISFPNGHWKNGWRWHRIVVLPDYQGRSIGAKIIEYFGGILKYHGCLLYYRTSHLGLVNWFKRNKNWQKCGAEKYTKKQVSESSKISGRNWKIEENRTVHSFKYVGPPIEDTNQIWVPPTTPTTLEK